MTRIKRVVAGLRFACIWAAGPDQPVLFSYKAANGMVYKLHPTKGWCPA